LHDESLALVRKDLNTFNTGRKRRNSCAKNAKKADTKKKKEQKLTFDFLVLWLFFFSASFAQLLRPWRPVFVFTLT
jgi:hypothetical protein